MRKIFKDLGCAIFKKNLISISALDAKGMRVAFVDGQVLMCPKWNTIDNEKMIGEEDIGL